MSVPDPLPPFVYIHRDCGYPAFYLKRKPAPVDPVRSSDGLHLDGRPIRASAPCLCDTCGEPVGLPKTANVLAMVAS